MSENNKEAKTIDELLESSDSLPVNTDDQGAINDLINKSNDALDIFKEEYSDLAFTVDEAKDIRKYLSSLRTGGSAGVGLICAGDDCEYRKACPLWKIKDSTPTATKDPDDPSKIIYIVKTKAPEGKPCPLEKTVVEDTRLQLIGHKNIDNNNPVHLSYINELCQLASLEWKVNMLLAFDHHGVTQKVPAAISPSGEVYFRREKNQLIEVLKDINDRRSRIMKELTISPEAEYKRRIATGEGQDDSLTNKQAETRARIAASKNKNDALPIPEHVSQSGENPKDNDKDEQE